MNCIKILSRGSMIAAVTLGCVSTAFAIPITIYDTLHGGSGDVNNVLYHPNETGTSVDATLNTSGGAFDAVFTSTSSLTTGGGQASLTGTGGTSFTDLCFSLLNGATFTKLQLNPDAVGNGFISFTVSYIFPTGSFTSSPLTLNMAGQNFFTIESTGGALMTQVCWTSTVGIEDANQYRVGGAALPSNVPDGGTTLIMLGAAIAGLGTIRRVIQS